MRRGLNVMGVEERVGDEETNGHVKGDKGERKEKHVAR